MQDIWTAVWGFGSTGSEVGTLGWYDTRAKAQAEVERFLSVHQDNPAVGAWVRKEMGSGDTALADAVDAGTMTAHEARSVQTDQAHEESLAQP